MNKCVVIKFIDNAVFVKITNSNQIGSSIIK